MASLTTVYFIGILIASLSGMGSAFVGSRIFPLTGGDTEEPTKKPEPQPEEKPQELEEEKEKPQELEDEEEKPLALEDEEEKPLALEDKAGGRKKRRR
jgi:hypothetical protein